MTGDEGRGINHYRTAVLPYCPTACLIALLPYCLITLPSYYEPLRPRPGTLRLDDRQVTPILTPFKRRGDRRIPEMRR